VIIARLVITVVRCVITRVNYHDHGLSMITGTWRVPLSAAQITVIMP
jgi:hypothetical protein